MTFVNEYEADLGSRNYSRAYSEESEIALSAIDCALNGEKGVYASSQLTTGDRAYELLHAHGLSNMRELDDQQKSALLKANIEEASEFAKLLRRRLEPGSTIITPAPFAAPGWTQAEYLSFWELLIRTRVKTVYFSDRWQYSNGCTFEFAIACEERIPAFDEQLRLLSVKDGATLIETAIADLESRGFESQRLRINLDRVRRIR
jgi:hypothetical protein